MLLLGVLILVQQQEEQQPWPTLPFPRDANASAALYRREQPALLRIAPLLNASSHGPYAQEYGDLWPRAWSWRYIAERGLSGSVHAFSRDGVGGGVGGGGGAAAAAAAAEAAACGGHFPFFVRNTALETLLVPPRGAGALLRCGRAPSRPIAPAALVRALQSGGGGGARGPQHSGPHHYFSGSVLWLQREPPAPGEGKAGAAVPLRLRAAFPTSAAATLGADLVALAAPLAAGAAAHAVYAPARKKKQQGGEGEGGAPPLPLLLQANVWMASAGSTTPAHYDTSHNVLLQVRGRKRITLLPPSAARELGLLPSLSPGHRQAARVISAAAERAAGGEGGAAALAGLRGATVVELGPGEALFIPAYWFHHVASSAAAASSMAAAPAAPAAGGGSGGGATLSVSLWAESAAHLAAQRVRTMPMPLAVLDRQVPLLHGGGASNPSQAAHWPEALMRRLAAARLFVHRIEASLLQPLGPAAAAGAGACATPAAAATGRALDSLRSRYRAAFPAAFRARQPDGKQGATHACTPWRQRGADGGGAASVAAALATAWGEAGSAGRVHFERCAKDAADVLRSPGDVTLSEHQTSIAAIALANLAENLVMWAAGATRRSKGRSPWLAQLPELVAACWDEELEPARTASA